MGYRFRVSNQPKSRPKAKPLDLSQFLSVEDAIEKLEAADAQYKDLASSALTATWPNLHWMLLFLLSTIKRATGLHRGVISGIRHSNPHAAFPLLRSYIELVILVAYVLRRPDYIKAVVTDPSEWQPGMPRRKSIQSLIALAEEEFPTIKAPYEELSDMGHFGSVAMWTAFEPQDVHEDENAMTIDWTNVPSWRHRDDPLKAAAHLLEFTAAFVQTVDQIIKAELLPLKPASEDA
jgi:hypothetical protein